MELIRNNWKSILDTVLSVGTLLLVVATVWMAWETRQLRFDESIPNISLSDAVIEQVNMSGTPIKRTSWKQGETLQSGSTRFALSRANLAVKFENSARDPGYIAVDNFEEINRIANVVQQISLTSTSSLPNLVLVPGGGETGWVFSIDVKDHIKEGQVTIPYNIKVYDIERDYIGMRKFYVTCQFPTDSAGYYNAICSPFVEQ